MQATISANVMRSEQIGAAQRGPALLAGLLRCRRCGHKLVVHYTGSHHDVLRYQCRRGWLDNGEPRCIGFAGLVVDQAITREILRVIQPAAIEAAVMAHEEQARKIDEVLAALQRDLEAAQYSARRAQKQYDAADPENRLVTDELERRWNQSLQRVREIEAQIEQHRDRQGPSAAPTREEFAELAADLESLWNEPGADARLKKRVIRTLIRDVIVDVDAQAGEVILDHSLERRHPYRTASAATAARTEQRADLHRAPGRGACARAHLLGSVNRRCSQSQWATDWTRQSLDPGTSDGTAQSSPTFRAITPSNVTADLG